jgi:hypothetical protein
MFPPINRHICTHVHAHTRLTHIIHESTDRVQDPPQPICSAFYRVGTGKTLCPLAAATSIQPHQQKIKKPVLKFLDNPCHTENKKHFTSVLRQLRGRSHSIHHSITISTCTCLTARTNFVLPQPAKSHVIFQPVFSSPTPRIQIPHALLSFPVLPVQSQRSPKTDFINSMSHLAAACMRVRLLCLIKILSKGHSGVGIMTSYLPPPLPTPLATKGRPPASKRRQW